MKKLMSIVKSNKGFTLIELMIVVGIIGILVSIAAPNFAKYQSKARQSEAKIALAAVYGAEKAFYSEYAAYLNSMDAVGYAPEGQKRFYSIGWSTTIGTAQGYSGSVGNISIARTNFPAAFTSCTITLGTLPANATADAQSFNVVAGAQLRDTLTTCDHWSITDAKIITNTSIGL